MTLAGFGKRDLDMLVSLFRMAVGDRFLGSGLGLAWAVLSPLMLMGIFVFVFSFVFPGRVPGRDGALPFVIWLISGYGPWLAISEGLNSSTGSVVGNIGIVKNIAFKSELLPIASAMLGLVPLLVSFVIIFALQIIGGEFPGIGWLAALYSIVLLFLFLSGLGLFLSSLNVFIRDVSLILPNILLILLFASPVFYRMDAYPASIRPILAYNPIYAAVECFRAPIVEGQLPATFLLIYMTILSVSLFLGGLWWFRRLKTFFDLRL